MAIILLILYCIYDQFDVSINPGGTEDQKGESPNLDDIDQENDEFMNTTDIEDQKETFIDSAINQEQNNLSLIHYDIE